jgi:hypothetical protein
MTRQAGAKSLTSAANFPEPIEESICDEVSLDRAQSGGRRPTDARGSDRPNPVELGSDGRPPLPSSDLSPSRKRGRAHQVDESMTNAESRGLRGRAKWRVRCRRLRDVVF